MQYKFAVGSKKGVDLLTRRLAADGYTVTSGPRITGDGYYEFGWRLWRYSLGDRPRCLVQ